MFDLQQTQYMTKYNDIDIKERKESDIITDSLWVIKERGKWWKHSNFYHWNFIPQIPNQLIRRYTKKWDYVMDPFIWSGTTAIECENLWRNIIGIDIQKSLIERLDELIGKKIKSKFIHWDSSDIETYKSIKQKNFVQLLLLHPPYFDIIKFSKNKHDISNAKNIQKFLWLFWDIVSNSLHYVKKWWYVWLVIWDKYQNSERVPLSFYCMQECQKYWLKLKSIVVKNMEGNRAKLWSSGGIWRYRALNSDYYIFKHEYIFIFKKV